MKATKITGTKLTMSLVGAFAVALTVTASGSAKADEGGFRPHKYEGFGAVTEGGNGKPVVHVTNLNSSGPGSLVAAVSQPNRYVVFDVAGTIPTPQRVYVSANTTVDGFTAPSPGIKLLGLGLFIMNTTAGAHDVIVRGLTIENTDTHPSVEDSISIGEKAYNVVVDHCYLTRASDENVGINDAHDITISWNIIGDPAFNRTTNFLINRYAKRVTVHHNLFIHAGRRNPWVTWDEPTKTVAPEIVADIRNNLMWDVGGEGLHHGTSAYAGAKINVVNNFYKMVDFGLSGAPLDEAGQKRAIIICRDPMIFTNTPEDKDFCEKPSGKNPPRLPRYAPARAFIEGNVSAEGWSDYINAKGTETAPFAAPEIEMHSAFVAAEHVLSHAGIEPGQASDLVSKSLLAQEAPTPRAADTDVYDDSDDDDGDDN